MLGRGNRGEERVLLGRGGCNGVHQAQEGDWIGGVAHHHNLTPLLGLLTLHGATWTSARYLTDTDPSSHIGQAVVLLGIKGKNLFIQGDL